jgi:hypothetical protein
MEVAMNAICRFIANAFSRAHHRTLLIALILPFLVALSPSPAKAISQDEAIDFVVEAAARGGQALGISIPAEAKELLKELIKCAANGASVSDCAKQSMINVLLKNVPDDAKKIVGCLLGGGDAVGCAKQAGLDNLPPEVRPVVECMLGGGTVADCAGKVPLPKEAQELLDKLKSLKADAEELLENQKGSVRNIIEIVKAVQEGNVGNIIIFGGQEFAKIVITVVIEALCPPCALIAGPVVAAMVDLYAGLAEDVFKMIKDGDLGKLPEILFEFYFQEIIARPCALLPDGGFKDAVCGNLAKVIAAAAGVVGDVVGFVLGVVGDIVKGIAGFFGDVWDSLFGDGLDDPEVCGSAEAFFAKNYLPCLGATAGASPALSPVPALHAACVANFKRCYKNAEGICNGLDKGLNDNAQAVNAALEQGARAYTPAVGAFIYGRREQFCTNGAEKSVENFRGQMSEFAKQCTDALGKNVPLQVAGCTFKSPNVTRPPGPSLACSRAVENSNWEQQVKNVCEAWCRENRNNCPPSPPPCFVHSNTVVESYGFTYVFSALERSICVIKPWGVWDKIWAVINPPNVIYDNRHVVEVLQNPAMRNPAWSATVAGAFKDAVMPGLSIGNCRATRTMLSANVQWTKTPVRTRLGQLLQQAPVSDTTRVALSSMFAIRLTPAVTESVALSLTPVALVPSFESCPSTASLASRGSSGSDGSYTPRSTTTKRTPERGGATANRGSSGSYTSRDPRGSSGSSTAVDRLTGDGMGGASSTPLYKLPDTARGPLPGTQPGSRGSSGVSTSSQPGGSSGASSVQSSGTPGTRSQGSSGASFTPGGGATGQFGPGAGSGTIRQNRPSIEILRRQQEDKPSPVR